MADETIDQPGDVAWVRVRNRGLMIALYDGQFWRGVDTIGPIKCVSTAVTERIYLRREHRGPTTSEQRKAAFIDMEGEVTDLTETIHRCPIGPESLTPCCGRYPLDLPRTDRLARSWDDVTCDRKVPV